MRFRLRTLLIMLGVLPPVIWVAWGIVNSRAVAPLFFLASYLALALLFVGASEIYERFVRLRRRAGTCSYCGQRKWPLAEGLDDVLICRACAAACVELIDRELSKEQGEPPFG